jgi:hypothetical protein
MNLEKKIMVYFGMILKFIVSKYIYIGDPKKTQAIVSMLIPTIHNKPKCLMGASPLRWLLWFLYYRIPILATKLLLILLGPSTHQKMHTYVTYSWPNLLHKVVYVA